MGAEFKFKFEFKTELITKNKKRGKTVPSTVINKTQEVKDFKNKSENERLTFIDGWSNSLVNSKFSNRYSVHCARCICKDKGN